MKAIRYSIAPAIFQKVPGYIRALVVVRGANNITSNPAVQIALREAEKNIRESFTTETLLADARIVGWREAFKQFGMNPSEFRPAHEALARRAVQAKPLPHINSLVDIGNAMSLAKLMPIGVHPIENVAGELSLRPAFGNEVFIPFGSVKSENPKPGEIVFADVLNIHARAWVWRQAQCSVTLSTTKDVVVHADALPPLNIDGVKSVCDELSERIRQACGGAVESHLLSAHNRNTEI